MQRTHRRLDVDHGVPQRELGDGHTVDLGRDRVLHRDHDPRLRLAALDLDQSRGQSAVPQRGVDRADAFGRGAWTRRQLNYTALSYGLHAAPPADLASYTADIDARFGPYTPIAETHQYAGFGHLDGYGSAYYTYLWSLIIAKDLLTGFTSGLMDPTVGRRYRDAILAPGGTADAAELVERFLGRPSSFDAFAVWLAEGTPA